MKVAPLVLTLSILFSWLIAVGSAMLDNVGADPNREAMTYCDAFIMYLMFVIVPVLLGYFVGKTHRS